MMKLQTLKHAIVSAAAVFGMMGMTSQALADDFLVTPSFTPLLNAVPTGAELVYKADFYTSGVDEETDGSAWSYYTTTFTGEETDEPTGATITWDAYATNYTACPNCYLVVKGGTDQYTFDISDWNGQDPLVLSGFWTGAGAISHVATYAVAVSAVPEASTFGMMLAGLGLVGFVARRKTSWPA